MDPSTKLLYHVTGFHPDDVMEAYYSPNTQDCFFQESTINIMTALHNAFTSGIVKGKSLIDMSFGPMIYQLFPICEFLEEIIVLEFNDLCIEKLQKWLNKDPDAYDWTHTLEVMTKLKGSREEWKGTEDMVRSRMKHIFKCDFKKVNPTDPIVLPKVDIAMSIAGLEVISEDKDIYLENLNKMSSFIKPGGYLLMFVNINASYVRINQRTYHLLNCDDAFLKKALGDVGYTIDRYEEMKRETKVDLVDHEKVVFVVARKVKNN